MRAINPTQEQIARIAHAIWEAEGRPEGRDHEQWMRARALLEEGRAETEYPEAAGSDEAGQHRVSAQTRLSLEHAESVAVPVKDNAVPADEPGPKPAAPKTTEGYAEVPDREDDVPEAGVEPISKAPVPSSRTPRSRRKKADPVK